MSAIILTQHLAITELLVSIPMDLTSVSAPADMKALIVLKIPMTAPPVSILHFFNHLCFFPISNKISFF